MFTVRYYILALCYIFIILSTSIYIYGERYTCDWLQWLCISYTTGSGKELWRTKLREGFFGGSGGNDVSVLIEDDKIFAGCAGRIYALRASDGKILWDNDLKGMGFNQIALARQGISVQFITRVEGTGSSSSNS